MINTKQKSFMLQDNSESLRELNRLLASGWAVNDTVPLHSTAKIIYLLVRKGSISDEDKKDKKLAVQALQNISEPIGYLRREAQKLGESIDGRGAVEFANNGMNISAMATDALKEINRV